MYGKKFGNTYYGYGNYRTGGSLPTNYRYTDQELDIATGLMYYDARFYDRSIGQFISPDTLIPDPTIVWDYNRFAYVRGNPLKYNDPTGHCPAPDNSSGNIICVDFFIQTDNILINSGHGDGRGFDPNSDPAKSRAYFYLHLDEDGTLTGVTSEINESCTVVGCFDPAPEHNIFTASQDPESGAISLAWSLTNGASSKMLSTGKAIYEAEADIGSMAIVSTLLDAVGGFILGTIDGQMTLTPSSDGTYGVSHLNRDPYPSLEIYQYRNGNLADTVEQYPERGFIGNLGPFIWLNPLAPNHQISER